MSPPTIPPSLPPASPPPPTCATFCAGASFLNGGSLTTTAYDFMCVKIQAGAPVCSPLYGTTGCPSDQAPCHMPHALGAPTPGIPMGCEDTAGRWADGKCARKLRKGKCHKRKPMRHCGLTCGTCTRRSL